MKDSKKIKSIIIYFLLAMILNIMLFSYKVDAANFTVSASKSEVTVGDTFTVTINGTGLIGKYSIKGSSNITISGDTSPWIENTSVTVTCTTKSAGKATVTVTPETVADANTAEDLNLSAKTVSVEVKEKQTETQQQTTTTTPSTSTNTSTNNNTQTQTPTETKKSSEARLSNFGIKPKEYDFSGFKKDKTEYSVEVPNSVTSVEVYATPADSKAKVSGTGTVTLNEGNNTIGVTVTAEDGTTKKTYKLTIKRKTASEEEAENGEARLSSLGIKPEEYDFSGFTSDQKEYSVEVPNEVEQIEVYATAMDSKAQISGTGMITLEEGENELKIEVIAQNGTKETYTIKVTRKDAEVTEKFGLSTLSIAGLTLNSNFKVGTYEYTVDLTEDISSLNIEAIANLENAEVEIIGNENLQEGENTITILVTNTETQEVVTYQIIVNKTLAVEEIVEETRWLKPSTWGKEKKIKIAIIIVLIILIISAIILKIKMGKENEEEKKLDFPGADELDKAISEHQELAEDETVNTPKIEDNKEEMSYVENTPREEVNSTENYIQDIAKDRFGEGEDIEVRPRRKGKHF